MDRTRRRSLWERAQRGWPPGFPLVQFPNAPLIVALLAWVAARLTDGAVHDLFRVVFTAGLATWAVLELRSGANWVRRVLGAAVLAAIAAGILRALA